MTKEIQNYVLTKTLDAILFDVNHETFDYKKNNWIFSTAILERIKTMIEFFCKKGWLNSAVKNSVHDYLIEARSIESEDYEYRVNLINEIISMVNTSTEYNSFEFYRKELAKRKNNKKYLCNYPSSIIDFQIPLVNYSIVFDAVILISHSEKVSDELFIKECLPSLAKNLFYYEGINSILKEFPQIFKNPTFYNRFICVLNVNNELSNNESYKSNKKFVKEVNKKIKKV